MRLFVAIDLDDDARAAIAALQKRLAREWRGQAPRWTRVEQLHVTLAFIGEVSEPDAAGIVEAMTPAIALGTYTLVLDRIGAFPPRGAPRVLWLGSADGARETIELQRAVVDRLTRAGVDLEPRPYHAHLTLARWRRAGEADRRQVLGAAEPGEVARASVDHTTLYQSRLSSQGSTYTVLLRTALQG